MSRIDEGDICDTADFLAACALEHNMKQALNGRKGQKFLRELEAELVAMPEKRLWRGVLVHPPEPVGVGFKIDGEACALGVVAVARAMAKGCTRDQAFQDVSKIVPKEWVENNDDPPSGWQQIKRAAKALGISTSLAYAIVYENDELSHGFPDTPDGRYEGMLHWVRSKIIKETA